MTLCLASLLLWQGADVTFADADAADAVADAAADAAADCGGKVYVVVLPDVINQKKDC
jgi:hypothetical protein